MKKKFMFVFAVLLIASMVLSACGADAPAEEPAADEAPADNGERYHQTDHIAFTPA